MRKVKVRALENFAGAQGSMYIGQVAEVDNDYADSLVKCGYLEIVKEDEVKENKRNAKQRRVAASSGNSGRNDG